MKTFLIRHFALVTLLFCSAKSMAQKYTISGSIKDKKNGELIIGAAIQVAENPSLGVMTNEYGFYSLSLPQGTYTIICSYIGFDQQQQTILLDKNTKIEWSLEQTPETNTLDEVIVSRVKKDKNLSEAQMGIETLNIKKIEKLPVLFGEKDVMKTIQLLPGIKSNGEGSSGFSVRGGAADQNLILLDEAPVYNASHLLGFFSTFNSDALKDASIIKGNSPLTIWRAAFLCYGREDERWKQSGL